jgi:HEAT repeat protein
MINLDAMNPARNSREGRFVSPGVCVSRARFVLGLFASVLAWSCLTASIGAQGSAGPSSEAGALARGWKALSDGNISAAGQIAARLLVSHPKSASSLALAVDVETARAGAMAGLHVYEQWVDTKRTEEAYVLRRVGQGFLREVARQSGNPVAKASAVRALLADGDSDVGADVTSPSSVPVESAIVQASVARNPEAVRTLIQQVRSPGPQKGRIIKALGDSGSEAATPVLLEVLAEPRPEFKSAAAEALGKIGSNRALGALKPLLDDGNFTVRLAAAGALYRLNDMSGLTILQESAQSQFAGVRIAAADAMSSRPDATWLALVRSLTEDSDPAIRLQAARLIAPHDAETARNVLQQLSANENPAIREEAGRTLAADVLEDMTALRRLLRSPDIAIQVGAADRILSLTR